MIENVNTLHCSVFSTLLSPLKSLGSRILITGTFTHACLDPTKKAYLYFFDICLYAKYIIFYGNIADQKTVQCHNISSVIRHEDESQNQNNKKTKHVNCFENQVFLTFDTLIMGGVGDKCLFFGKFGGICFLVTSVLRFALSPYY